MRRFVIGSLFATVSAMAAHAAPVTPLECARSVVPGLPKQARAEEQLALAERLAERGECDAARTMVAAVEDEELRGHATEQVARVCTPCAPSLLERRGSDALDAEALAQCARRGDVSVAPTLLVARPTSAEAALVGVVAALVERGEAVRAVQLVLEVAARLPLCEALEPAVLQLVGRKDAAAVVRLWSGYDAVAPALSLAARFQLVQAVVRDAAGTATLATFEKTVTPAHAKSAIDAAWLGAARSLLGDRERGAATLAAAFALAKARGPDAPKHQSPLRAEGFVAVGRAALAIGDPVVARRAFDAALASPPSSLVQHVVNAVSFALAQGYLELDQRAAAARSFAHFRNHNPCFSVPAYAALGRLALSRRAWDAALDYVGATCVAIAPLVETDSTVAILTAWHDLRATDPKAQFLDGLAARVEAPEFENRAAVQVHLASAYAAAGQRQRAERLLSKVWRGETSRTWEGNLLIELSLETARAMSRLGRPQEAVTTLLRLVDATRRPPADDEQPDHLGYRVTALLELDRALPTLPPAVATGLATALAGPIPRCR